MNRIRFAQVTAMVTLSLAGLWGCTTSSTKSINAITEADTTYFSDPEERELFDEAERLHQEFVRKGLIYRNSGLSQYIHQLGQDLQPEQVKQKFRLDFFVFRDPSINAFALPNGNIYLHIGLINKLENEAQLAFVMAHEAAHVLERHSFQGKISRRNELVTAHLTDFLLAGTGLSYLAAVSGISSHSRQMEAEADQIALEFISQTNYQSAAIENTFNLLIETKHGNKESNFWASHPAAELRTANAKKHFEQQPSSGDKVSTEQFERLQNELAERTIKMRLRKKQFQLAEEDIQVTIQRQGESAQWLTYLGDSYRQRLEYPTAAAQEQMWLYEIEKPVAEQKIADARSTQSSKAMEYYSRAIHLDPDYAQAHRGIGLLLAASDDKVGAKKHLEKYLSYPTIQDRRYIETIKQKL